MSFTPINGIMDPSVKTEPKLSDSTNGAATDKVEKISPSKVTPRKRNRKKAVENNGDAMDEDTEPSPSKKGKATPKRSATIPIPNSYEMAGPEDRMMLRMKDVENRSWKEIQAAWEDMTGAKVADGSLTARYRRMKANFVVFADGDENHLIQIKKDVEEKFEVEKWHKIAEGIEAKSGNKYPPAAVQKKFKELLKKRNTTSGTVVKEEN